MPEADLRLRRLIVRNYRGIHELDVGLPGNLKVLCFVGPNGAGKSGLISLLAHAVCQLTHELIRDCGHDTHDGNAPIGASLLTSEIGDVGQSCCVRSDWTVMGSDLTHCAFVRYSDHPVDEFTRQLIHEMGLPANCESYFGWTEKPSPDEDCVARSVLLFRSSDRFERLDADRPCYEEVSIPTADELLDVAASRTDLHPSADVKLGRRRFLPVCPQSGLRHVEAVVASIRNNEIDDRTRRWAERVTIALSLLHDTGEEFAFELGPDGTIGIRHVEILPDGTVRKGRCEALSLLSAAEADVLVTVGHIALQQLYLDRKFDRSEISRWGASGWVFIDEVDSHLHPSWQDRIVPRLCLLFPTVHFVVTTQSPFVLRSLPRDVSLVVRLPEGEAIYDDCGAMSIESILRLVFDMPSAWNEEIEYELHRLESYASDSSQHKAAIAIYRTLAKRSAILRSRCDEIIVVYGTDDLVDELAAEGARPPIDKMMRVERRAYEIWDEEGRPEDGWMKYWAKAETEVEQRDRVTDRRPR